MTSSLYGAGAEYALHSLLVLAARKEPVSVADLARFQALPERFLAKLFTRLEKAKLVVAAEGARGGFQLVLPPEQITVRDILIAVDPHRTLFACAEIRRHCALFDTEPPAWSVTGMCRIHLFLKDAEDQLQNYLASKTLADLMGELEQKAPREFLVNAEHWFQERRSLRLGSPPSAERRRKSRE